MSSPGLQEGEPETRSPTPSSEVTGVPAKSPGRLQKGRAASARLPRTPAAHGKAAKVAVLRVGALLLQVLPSLKAEF